MTSEQDSLDRAYQALSLRVDIEKSVQERIDKSVAQLRGREGGVYLSRERAEAFADAVELMARSARRDRGYRIDEGIAEARAKIIEILTGEPNEMP